jgi:hypothetical protein
MHFMQQIINEVQVQCGGNNIALMQTKVTCEAVRVDFFDMFFYVLLLTLRVTGTALPAVRVFLR